MHRLTSVVALSSILGIGCGGPPLEVYHLKGSRLQSAIHELHQDKPEVFAYPFTLVIAVDASPCPKWLQESVWWSEWQRRAKECGHGFIFVTSRADSADLVLTARLDSVVAPVLVLPSCNERLSELDVPDAIPLKLLVDSTSTIRYGWSPMKDSVESQGLVDLLDSLCQSPDLAQDRSGPDHP